MTVYRLRACMKRIALAVGLVLMTSLLMVSGTALAETRPAWKLIDSPRPPFDEASHPSEVLKPYVNPPAYLVEAANEGRVIAPLRLAAQGKSKDALVLATATYALARAPKASPKATAKIPVPGKLLKLTPVEILTSGVHMVSNRPHGKLPTLAKKPTDAEISGWRKGLATAFADMAVSGRKAYGQYKKAKPTEAT